MSSDLSLNPKLPLGELVKHMRDNGFEIGGLEDSRVPTFKSFTVSKGKDFVYCFVDVQTTLVESVTRYGISDATEFVETLNKCFKLDLKPGYVL